MGLWYLDQDEQAFGVRLNDIGIAYDVAFCDADRDIVREICKKTSTQSVIGIGDEIPFPSFDDYPHLCYVSRQDSFCILDFTNWWEQQKANAWTSFFSPQGIVYDSIYCSTGTIAHIKIFIQTPTHVRLQLLHFRADQLSISIQEGDQQRKLLSSDEIPTKLTPQYFELGWFEEGRHELEMVVQPVSSDEPWYALRDIQIEFHTEQPQLESATNVFRPSQHTQLIPDIASPVSA